MREKRRNIFEIVLGIYDTIYNLKIYKQQWVSNTK